MTADKTPLTMRTSQMNFSRTSTIVHITNTILWILILSHISAASAENNIGNIFDSPTLILPAKPDVTVLPSETYKLKCKSTEPVSWRFPSKYFDGSHVISEAHAVGDERPYETILELLDIDYKFVGYYYCVPKTWDDETQNLLEDGKVAKIYLFVEDPNHPVADVIYPMIDAHQYKDVVIPCKPTSRRSSVELIKEGDKSHQFDSTFSPTIGYTIKLMELTDGGSYMCRPKEDESGEHDIHFDVHVNSGKYYINTPIISSKTESYGIEGGELELNCSVQVDHGILFDMNWILPNQIAESENRVKTYSTETEVDQNHPGKVIGMKRIKVTQLDRTKDVGIYKCEVKDHSENRNSKQINIIQILGKDESFINITEPTGSYKIELSSKKTEAKWNVKFAGHPAPQIVWRDNKGNEIPWSTTEDKERKFEAILQKGQTTLTIRRPELSDSGDYILAADNGRDYKEQKFQLFRKQTPRPYTSNVSVKPGEVAVLSCDIVGYPSSTISWSFIPCNNFAFDETSCNVGKKVAFSNDVIENIQNNIFNQTSKLSFKPDLPGIATCLAKNSEGTNTTKANVVISDLDEDLQVWSANQLPIAVGDEVSVTCGASVYKYATELSWFKDNILIESSEDIQVILHNTPYSHQKELRWSSISKLAAGNYVCRANVIKDDSADDKLWVIDVTEARKPEIDFTNINESILKHSLGEPLQLQCIFSGVPRPTINWFKDDHEIIPDDNDTRTVFHEDNTVLDIKYIKVEDEGKFQCIASNRIGSVSRETILKISNMPTVSKALIIGVATLILVLVICTIYLCLRIRRERKVLRELKEAGLANFEEGSPDCINPDLALDEQADLLPYDKKYEFPKDKLKLGKQLGAGAFGVVVKGYAHGIFPYEEETTVAVKMVKKTADNEVMRALISELKIMVHLGQHLNVVNLLGAVTKNIAKREVMVIVEYCRFGNLQNFLIKHREYFVDQIDRDKDIIDPTILTKEQRWSNDSGYEYFNSQGLKYVKLTFTNNHQNHNHNISGKGQNNRQSAGAVSHVNSAYVRHSSVADYFPGGMDSANTEATLISRNTPGGEDNFVMSNNSTQPAWRSNYRMDYKGPARTVTTSDLLCWSFQVSCGMQYLSSRKVLHGDLAARNILLCDDNVVKICDFGLARSMYKSDNYKKKGETPLPFKWLAIESISDQVFSTYSDVWSFGIVMWELFSLGKVPYPGMDADQGLYFKLKDGYRMEKPQNATQEIYDIMLQCWGAHPESRPLFDSLEKSLRKMMENNVAEHYIDLNEPYLQMNVQNFTDGQTDYLALMAAPDCQAPKIPQYVNSHLVAMPITSAPIIPNYLTMSPTVNSPTDGIDTHDTHFQFPALNSPTTANNLNANPTTNKFRTKIPDIPEEIPMLKRSNQSINTDSETEANSPNAQSGDQLKSSCGTDRLNALRSSPNDSTRKNVNVLSTAADNYVNVPSTIINMNKSDAVSNPGYVVVGTINETRT